MKAEPIIEYRGIINQEGKEDSWADQTIPRIIEDMYYVSGKTGADALIDFWTDVKNGKYMEICRKLEIPNHFGLVHSVSTLAKHFIASGKIDLKKE
jgi:hypothetical protein